ncbi:response regulator [Allostreptomyces psammosilenae]|uniref:DNA-binding NarL/FixJ family response regulator n=1 Tax=Allostreptomyces psammosilenae TaxID=1892865 RepID=A0A852ZWK5_9ACTN|nr:response regulator transcription factor [Allostreptomyces psammosilenae]NYI06756.1 DNA-binding NarL/FixJ family response regulator [Allostreptomyces psammosilenae]
MIRVVLADDEVLIRAGVRAILAADPEIEVVAEAADGHQAVDLARRHRPDIILLDIRMPGLDGLAAAAEIRRAAPGTGVVVLTTFSEDDYIDRALAEGASGFLLKTGAPRELIAGVRAVAEGAAYLSPRVARRVVSEYGAATRSGRRPGGAATRDELAGVLTERELRVLALVGAGRTNREIAAELHVVEGTVKAYVSAILGRIGVRNRVEAAIVAYKAGLVPDEPS